MEDIPNDLVLNWDHTGIKYVPVGNWTRAKEGSKRVDIVGMDDKRQITAVFGCTMEGEFLPPQIIYGGKFPGFWDITYFFTGQMKKLRKVTFKIFWSH
jgi:hypothetical protein